jgi:hypothetical protein
MEQLGQFDMADRMPCRSNSAASIRLLLKTQRNGDSGSPHFVLTMPYQARFQ